MASVTVTVEHLEWGQKPYGPHVYEARITIRGEQSWDRLLEGQMRDLVKAVVANFYTDEEAAEKYPNDMMGRHFLPKLRGLARVEERALTDAKFGPVEEVWIARVEQPFTD